AAGRIGPGVLSGEGTKNGTKNETKNGTHVRCSLGRFVRDGIPDPKEWRTKGNSGLKGMHAPKASRGERGRHAQWTSGFRGCFAGPDRHRGGTDPPVDRDGPVRDVRPQPGGDPRLVLESQSCG